MGKIVILDKSIADKIAAGEVVERPASVIKELVENSLDAGAKNIRINLESGGQDLIEIIDDGAGMSEDDVQIAIQRFATSKITRWEDLEGLRTFGFRGEALPSIAAVSRMEIFTREAGSEEGVHLFAEGGDITTLEPAGTPQGTRIRIADLFFNTPARRKFLKSASSETAHIVGVAQKLSLMNGDISFQVSSNGREIFHFPASMSIKERILKIWGLPLDYEIVPLEYESGFVRVTGFICKPDKLKTHRSYQLFFVNDRYIKNQMVSQALVEGFNPLLPAGKFPMALLFIDVRGTDVDINVHPNKLEVRFAYPSAIFKTVRDAIKKELKGFGYAPVPNGRNGGRTDANATIGEVVTPEAMAEMAASASTDGMNAIGMNAIGMNTTGANTAGIITTEDLTSSYPEELIRQADSYFAGNKVSPLKETLNHVEGGISKPDSGFRSGSASHSPLFKGGRGDAHKSEGHLEEKSLNNRQSESSINNGSETTDKADLKRYLSTYDALPLQYHPESPVPQAITSPVMFPAKPVKNQIFTALAQIKKTYILGIAGDELWIVDQHTAHERINYEKLGRVGRDLASKSQQLLFPVMLELPATLYSFLIDKEKQFEDLGFEIEPFGGSSVLIKAVPFGFARLEKENALMTILEEVAEGQPYRNLESVIERIRSTIACKASVKAGDPLTIDEMNSLVNDMVNMDYSSFCPHGRPVVIKLSKEHLDRMFHRI